MQGTPIDFPSACQYVGQLLLETRHQIELLSRQLAEATARAAAAEKERDDALALLAKKAA